MVRLTSKLILELGKTKRRTIMSSIKVLGIDLGKSSFHVIGRDKSDNPIFRKKFTRSGLITYLQQLPKCLIAFEACGGGTLAWQKVSITGA